MSQSIIFISTYNPLCTSYITMNKKKKRILQAESNLKTGCHLISSLTPWMHYEFHGKKVTPLVYETSLSRSIISISTYSPLFTSYLTMNNQEKKGFCKLSQISKLVSIWFPAWLLGCSMNSMERKLYPFFVRLALVFYNVTEHNFHFHL